MHQIGSIRWSNDGREQQETPRESVGVSQNRKLWLLVPTLVVHIDKNPNDVACRIGTDNPIAISKNKNNPCVLFGSLYLAFGCFCSFGTGSGKDNLCFLSKFPDTFLAYWNAQQAA
jgi:hypothetical protein